MVILIHGNVVRGIRDTWYLMDGAEIISRHRTRADADEACTNYRRYYRHLLREKKRPMQDHPTDSLQ